MKKIYLLFVLLFTATASADAQNMDSLVSLIYKEKTDSARIRRFYDVYFQYSSIDPVKAIETQKQLRSLAKRRNDRVLEAITTSELGDLFSRAGATVQGTSLLLDAVRLAEATGNPQAIGITYQNLSIFTHDPVKSRQYDEKALHYSTLAADHLLVSLELLNLGYFYLEPDHLHLDSALHYAERSYQVAIAKKVERSPISCLLLFSKVHLKLGNDTLALEYIRSAEHLSESRMWSGDIQAQSLIYNYYTNYYLAVGPRDSAFFYAYKGLDFSKRTFFRNMKEPADALRLLYAGKNADSALKYTNLYHSIKDSMQSEQTVQQVQAMNFEESVRQEKLEAEREAAREEHRHNLQYAGISIGLVVFVILFFLFSRSVMANAKVINFLGILSLLIVFEFFNLLIHPYIGELTHHSPVIMLGFMVCLAAVLIPLHHKLEHWVTHKLIEKNKKIRLARGKKVVEQEEGKHNKVEADAPQNVH